MTTLPLAIDAKRAQELALWNIRRAEGTPRLYAISGAHATLHELEREMREGFTPETATVFVRYARNAFLTAQAMIDGRW